MSSFRANRGQHEHELVPLGFHACHQALNNQDILLHIFETGFVVNVEARLQPEYERRPNRRWLARCAHVSKSFNDPALQVLWRELDSLVPLWYLIAPIDLPRVHHFNKRLKLDRVSSVRQ